MTHQDTGKHRTNKHDQFYTSDVVAKQCVQWIITAVSGASGDCDCLWVEPSAGTGAFLHQLPPEFTKIGLDIDPKCDDIIKQDYLIWNPDTAVPKKKGVIVFGNPPLGGNPRSPRHLSRKAVRLRILSHLFSRSHSQSRVCIMRFIRVSI